MPNKSGHCSVMIKVIFPTLRKRSVHTEFNKAYFQIIVNDSKSRKHPRGSTEYLGPQALSGALQERKIGTHRSGQMCLSDEANMPPCISAKKADS